jgi:uncharacterized membrane protein YvlD (DUF360 family)
MGTMLVKLLVRVICVAAAFVYVLPHIDGVKMSSDLVFLVIASLIFNLLFTMVEWLLDVVVIGVNISTLSIGLMFARLLEFVFLLLAPSVALYGCAKFMPRICDIENYYPSTIVAGIALGGVLFAQQIASNRK